MNLFVPASFLWFMRHELRISWRYLAAMGGGKGRSLFFTLGFIVLISVMLAFLFGPRIVHITPLSPLSIIALALIMAFMTSLMFAQILGMATLIFYDRGDLDMMLASPVRPWKILAVRMVAMAFNALLFYLVLVGPLIVTGAAFGGWGLLAAPVVLASLALLSTSLGVSIAMGLFRLLGPRRTRTVAQLFGALIGVSFLLIRLMIPTRGNGAVMAQMRTSLEASWWGPFATWMARAATGDLLPLACVVVASAGVFVLVTGLLGARFAADASIAAGAVESAPRRSSRQKTGFAAGLMRNMVGKELKLLSRDPALISQVLLQVIYLPIIMFVSMRGGRNTFSAFTHLTYAVAAGAMVYVAGQLAAGLGWLTISAEEAPELLTAAPVTSDEVARAKVLAVVLPVAVLLAVLSAFLAWFSPWSGLIAFVGSCACAAVIAYVELWLQRPGKRSAYRMRRRGTGSIWVGLLETLVCGLAGATAGMIAGGTLLAIIPGILLFAVIALIASVNKDKWLSRAA